nr:2416_t:CDS:2 [Entrophospora candida]
MQILPNSANIETLKELVSNIFDLYKDREQSFSLSADIEIIAQDTNKRKPAGIIEQMLTKKLKNNNLSSVNEIEEFLTINVEPTNINPCECEQAFSKSGELISKKRNRLGDRAVEACMCLNSWIKL